MGEVEARAQWRQLGHDAELVDLGGLLDVLAGDSKADVASGDLPRDLGLFWDAQSLARIEGMGNRLRFLKGLLAEVRRLDRLFDRVGNLMESEAVAVLHLWEAGRQLEEKEGVAVLSQVARAAKLGHYNRAGLLWLLSRYARNAADVAAVLVLLEDQSFWRGSLWQPAFQACARVLAVSRGASSVVAATDDEHSQSEQATDNSEGEKKGGKKKKKLLKKRLKKYTPSVSVSVLPEVSASREGKVTRRLCFWVRPSLEWVGKSELLARAKLVPQMADCGAIAGNVRVHLDNGKFRRYKQTVRSRDPSLLDPTEESVDCAVAAEWDGIGSVVRMVVSKANGVFSHEFLSGVQADALLRRAVSNSDAAICSLVKDSNLSPSIRAVSTRDVFVHVDGNVSVVWDANVAFSSALSAPARSGMLAWTLANAAPAAFPYQIVTVTVVDGGSIPKDLLAVLDGDSFISAPDFDEYATGAALLHDVGGGRPPWMAPLLRAWKNDWMQAFHADNPKQIPPWMEQGGGKEKGKEEDAANEDDFSQEVGAALSMRRGSYVPMEVWSEGAALLEREPWDGSSEPPPLAKKV